MSERVVDAVVEKSVLQQFIDTYTPVVSEAKVHFNDDGIAARAVDPANVAMALADVDTAAFESYSSGAVTVGVDLDTLDKRLSVGGSGDLVHLGIDMESRMLDIEIGIADQEIALIDPDAIRQEPDQPDLDLPNTLTVEGSVLKQAINVADMVSDHIEIVSDPHNDEVRFVGKGDTDQSTITVDEEVAVDMSLGDDGASLFSMDYMGELSSPIPSDAEVTLTFGSEFPILIDWAATEGHQTTRQFLAPRIQSN